MKNAVIYILFFMLTVFIVNCKDTSVNDISAVVNYTEVLTADFSGYNVKMYLANTDSLTTGYNEIFFKVNSGGTEQKTGAVKFYPKMWMTPRLWHGTPVCSTYTYDNSIGYYRGYVIFAMPSQAPALNWNSFITYRNASGTEFVSDSLKTNVVYRVEKQWKLFEDSTSLTKYFLALTENYTPTKGLSNLGIVLNKSDDLEQVFAQVTDARMFINVYNADSLTSSTGNVQPIIGSDGIYRGKINLPYAGRWKVSDTVFYNNHYITNNPPPLPEFIFEVQ